jgi:hypothetical protein
MTEMKVRREDRVRKCDVTFDNRGFNLPLESQDFGGVALPVGLSTEGLREEGQAKGSTE